MSDDLATAEQAAAGPVPTGDAFVPPWWLRNPHLQTIVPAILRRTPRPRLRRESLDLPDGDFLDLLWGPARDGPVALLLHGLGGSYRSPYVLGMAATLAARGWQTLIMHYRGVQRPNRLPRFYHAGDYADPQYLVSVLRRRFAGRAIAVIGYSIGGSILLNWLARADAGLQPDVAAAVSVPFDLALCAEHIDRGFARLYQRDLLWSLKRMVRRKLAVNADACPVTAADLGRLRSLREFDDRITAPVHGFSNARDYYRRCSCGPLLTRISRPTLIVHAADDPFIPARTIPERVSGSTRLCVTDYGGHVGFRAGDYWLEQAIPEFLAQHVARQGDPPRGTLPP